MEEQTLCGRISLKGFYLRRFFRIYPPLVTFLLALLALKVLVHLYVPTKHWVASLGMFANYLPQVWPDSWTWYLGHFWSLAVEEHFYLLWPTLLVLAGVARGMYLAAGLAVAVIAWRATAQGVGLAPNPQTFFQRTDVVADGLLWGCVAALAYARPWGQALARRVGGPVWYVLLVAAFAPAFLDDSVYPINQMILTGQSLILPLLIMGTVAAPHGAPGRLLETTAFRWVGRLSYSLYLWQQLFLADGPFRNSRLSLVQQVPVALVCTFACAAASYFLIERPLMRLGHRLAKPATAGREDLVKAPAAIPATPAAALQAAPS